MAFASIDKKKPELLEFGLEMRYSRAPAGLGTSRRFSALELFADR
ncbi:hypothetical protein VDG1235_2787 [Verrucomicrobiia bacterium DG1235]|nr:hypothetical protein VDG1235_2787 [Verrucomicrobiae bacterium DG1235]